MAFRLIDGGLTAGRTAAGVAARDGARPSRDDVRREAERRLKAAGHDTWRNRHIITGMPMPRELGYYAMQIGFVAEALGRLPAIPSDFRSDIYWPASKAPWVAER